MQTLIDSQFFRRNKVIIEMVRIFGKLTERWWSQWESEVREKYFEEDGTPKPKRSGQLTLDLKTRLEDIRRDDEDGRKELAGELEMLEEVLGKMLRYEPEERISIEEVVSILNSDPLCWDLVTHVS